MSAGLYLSYYAGIAAGAAIAGCIVAGYLVAIGIALVLSAEGPAGPGCGGDRMKRAAGTWSERALRALSEAGFRSGGGRRKVVEVLGHEGCALTALEIDRKLPDVGRATVYRALDQLERLGLIQRVDVGGDAAGYERVDPGGHHHHHIVCEQCGRVIAFEDDQLETAILRAREASRLHGVEPRGDAAGRVRELRSQAGLSRRAVNVPFAPSIAILTLVQASLIALPARATLPIASRLANRWWALVLPGSIVVVIAGIALEPGLADGLTYLALVAVPLLAALALAMAVRGAQPLLAVARIPLFVLAFGVGGLTGQAAALALSALACVALGTLVASLVPPRWLRLAIYAMAAIDTCLVAADLLQNPIAVAAIRQQARRR